MRTTTCVHSPQERLRQRERAERICLRSRWRLMLCASALRTAATLLLPAAGAAAWWMTALCLAPGYVLYGLACLALRLSGKATLQEMLPRWAWAILRGMALLALAAEGVAGMTALITFFTQGVGTAGTQWTMALLTAGLLILCLRGDGLARGIRLMRWVLLGALALWAWGGAAHADVMLAYPLGGTGMQALRGAFLRGSGCGWGMLLPLLQPAPTEGRRLHEPLAPALLCVGCAALCCLTVPQEVWTQSASLAESMLLTVGFRPGALRLIGVCLWTVALFLQLAGVVEWAAELLHRPAGRLPVGLAFALALTQLLPVQALWDAVGAIQPWLLTPLGLAAVCVLPALIHRMRRNRT